MNLSEWQSNPALAEEYNKTLELPILKMAREVADSMSPNRQLAALNHAVIASNSQFELGKIAGYHMRDMIEADLREPLKEPRQPKDDYPDPTTQQNKK